MLSPRERAYRALMALLRSGESLRLSRLQELSGLEREALLSYLSAPSLSVSGDEVHIVDKASLALEMARHGIHVEDVLLSLGWRDVEEFCAATLTRLGFRTIRNLRFRHSSERYEVDVVAYRHPFLLSIDCKRVRRASEHLLRSAAARQLERTTALSFELWRCCSGLELARARVLLVPAVVTVASAGVGVRVYEGVPVVPAGLLDAFVSRLGELAAGGVRAIEVAPPRGLRAR